MDVDIPMDASVECTDGVCGRSVYLVVNPIDQKVTHLVVKETLYPHTERIIPAALITQTAANLIQLKCTKQEFSGQEEFVHTEYIKSTVPPLLAEPPYFGPPFSYGRYSLPYAVPAASGYVTVHHKRIPAGELAVRRGAHVKATDGRIGQVDEFLLDPATQHITHLILREGHLWGQRDVVIPVSDIDHIEEDVVLLKLDKRGVEALPAIPIRRWSI